MTYTEVTRDLKRSRRDYDELSKVFFTSFLEVKTVRKNQILEREAEISQLCELLTRKILRDRLSKHQKIALMDYIENLQLAIDRLEEMRNPRVKEGRIKAARHLGKKMQSSFSD